MATRADNAPARSLRRQRPSVWARALGLVCVYVLLLPLSYLLRVFGLWPDILVKLGRRRRPTFGTYRPSRHDVIVAAYFKSGTNWTMQMAQQIAHRGEAEFEHIHDIVPWPDLGPDARYAIQPWDTSAVRASPTGLRVIKTHLPLGNVPYVPSSRYICVVRDPKDVLISSFFFVRSIILGPLMPLLSEWKRLSLMDGSLLGDWAVHLDSFWRVRDCENILFLTYEKMKRDSAGTVREMAEFMGVELTDEQQSRIVEKSSFEFMRGIGHKFDPVGIALPWAKAAGSMMRKGKSGDSSEYLSKPDRDEIDKHWRLKLEALGCDFPYDERYAAEPIAD